MKSYILLAFVVLVVTCPMESANAQDSYPSIVCEECRRLRLYPKDYRNFAYNQFVRDDGWMSVEDLDFFRLTNPAGNTVLIDMNLSYGSTTIDLGVPIPLPWPDHIIVQIILNYANGDRRVFELDTRAYPDGLPVGCNNCSGDSGAGGGGGGGGYPDYDYGDDDYTGRCGYSVLDDGKRRLSCL